MFPALKSGFFGARSTTAHGASAWLFLAPQSQTATTRKVEDDSLVMEQGGLSVVVRVGPGIAWPTGKGSMTVSPSGNAKLFVTFAMGPTAEAKAACSKIAAEPEHDPAGVERQSWPLEQIARLRARRVDRRGQSGGEAAVGQVQPDQ